MLMYEKLKKLNLETYMKCFCGGEIKSDSYLSALESFLNSLTEKNFNQLEEKFRGEKQKSEIIDLLHEVEIAYVFHPKANFLNNEGPDLENGVFIEIKTLNESEEERERHKTDRFCALSTVLNEKGKANEKKLVDDAINRKVTYHLEKANKQLKGMGLIYLIWDYDFLLHGEDKQVYSPIKDGERVMKDRVEKII